MTPGELVAGVSGLVSLPEVCVRVNELVGDPQTTAAELGEVVGHDPALATRLLGLVNSSFYGLSAEIETISHAVAMVGFEELRSLALASSMVDSFRDIPSELVDMASFWHHSVYTGLLAKIFAEEAGMGGREQLFLCGLLHDVGKLVLFHQLPGRCRELLMQVSEDGRRLHEAEQAALGFTHADVGAELLREWNLPEVLWEPVAAHHTPAAGKRFPRQCALIHLANAVAATVEPAAKDGGDVGREALRVDSGVWEVAGVSEGQVGPAVQEANLRSLEVLAVVAPAAALIV